jgi:hypothetical protein
MTRSLLEHPSAPDFLREFQEEHLSELAFLLAQRRRYWIHALRNWLTRAARSMREPVPRWKWTFVPESQAGFNRTGLFTASIRPSSSGVDAEFKRRRLRGWRRRARHLWPRRWRSPVPPAWVRPERTASR